jgi:hypothetical protein
MEVVGYMVAILAAGLAAGILCMAVFSLARLVFPPAKTPDRDAAVMREKNFKSNMDERQHQLNAHMRGASMVEVWMTFEARLYALEQRVIAAEKQNLDDGK